MANLDTCLVEEGYNLVGRIVREVVVGIHIVMVDHSMRFVGVNHMQRKYFD